MKRWQKSRRIIIQSSLLAACCLSAVWIRRVIDADTLSDLASVSVEFGGLALFILCTALATRAAYRVDSAAERVALRAIPLCLIVAGATFAKASYADVSVALHALTSRDADGPTKIEIGPSGRDVRLTGSLSEGAGQQLAELLETHPGVTRIHLTSDGGLVDEGEALRKVIADRHLTTFVPDYCVSACTLAFLGGRERLIMTGARLGFHAPFEEGLFGQIFEGDKRSERASYISSGLEPDFVDEALGVASVDMWTPDVDVLTKANAITGVVDRYRFPDSNLDGMATLAGARATVLRNFPAAKALDHWRPKDVDAIAASYLVAYQEGLSEGEVTDGLKAVIGAAASSAIIGSDDDTIVGYGRFLKEAVEAASSDADCATIGTEADLLQAEEILDRGDGQAERLAIALLTRALKSPRKLIEAGTPAEHPAVRKVALQGTCTAIRGFYSRALDLPRHDAAALIRSLARREAGAPGDRLTHED